APPAQGRNHAQRRAPGRRVRVPTLRRDWDLAFQRAGGRGRARSRPRPRSSRRSRPCAGRWRGGLRLSPRRPPGAPRGGPRRDLAWRRRGGGPSARRGRGRVRGGRGGPRRATVRVSPPDPAVAAALARGPGVRARGGDHPALRREARAATGPDGAPGAAWLGGRRPRRRHGGRGTRRLVAGSRPRPRHGLARPAARAVPGGRGVSDLGGCAPFAARDHIGQRRASAAERLAPAGYLRVVTGGLLAAHAARLRARPAFGPTWSARANPGKLSLEPSVGLDLAEAVRAVDRPVHPRLEWHLRLVAARRANDREIFARRPVVAALVAARAADLADVVAGVPSGAPAGPAARAA